MKKGKDIASTGRKSYVVFSLSIAHCVGMKFKPVLAEKKVVQGIFFGETHGNWRERRKYGVQYVQTAMPINGS